MKETRRASEGVTVILFLQGESVTSKYTIKGEPGSSSYKRLRKDQKGFKTRKTFEDCAASRGIHLRLHELGVE